MSSELAAASSAPAILAILAGEENYGYVILQRIRASTVHPIPWADGMLYPVLHRLERVGQLHGRWETSADGRRRKYYRRRSTAPAVPGTARPP